MDLLARILEGGDLQASWAPDDDRWYQPVGSMSIAGIPVDAEGAQKLSAWYRGRDILATVLAMLPFPLYERLPHNGGSHPAIDHPFYDILHDTPNGWQDSFQWRREKVFDLIDHGWTYDWIVAGPRGFVDELHPIEPTLVTPEQIKRGPSRGRYLFHVRDEQTGRTTPHTQEEIFYLRGAGGKGILEYARTSIGTALATESYAAQIFSKGTLNGGYIETPGVLDEEPARRMARSFATKVGEWHLPKVLEQGAKFFPNKLTPEDAQMLLSRKHSVDDIARWLGMPRQMLENSDPSFGNAEQFWQGFLTVGMGGWLSLFEFGVNGQLILKPKQFYAEFTRDAIARGNLTDRWNVHVAAVNAGIKTVDEARGKEGLNARGGKADELREPQNITGKPAVAEDDAEDAPPVKKTAAPTRRKKADDDDDDDEPEDRARAIVTASAARVLRKEVQFAQKAAVKFAADPAGFTATVDAFYRDHHTLVMQTMCVDEPTARGYVAIQCAELRDGLAITEGWTPAYLAGLALDAGRTGR